MRFPNKLVASVIVLILSLVAGVSAAPIGSSTDSVAIRSPASGARTSATQPMALPSLGVDVTRMLVALAIVIGLIYASRWILKRFYGGSVSPAGNRVVQVLSRTVLAPKQQIMLLQVGRRVIVVGESSGAMATLAEIDDPDEIAQLVGRLQDEQASRSGSFGGLFGRAQQPFASDEPKAPGQADRDDLEAEETPGAEKSELSGLLEKVKTIRRQMDS